ncbi:MAG: hypothetical protein AAGA67_10540, partial [Cyanobacteria bacterium P01_F01_bin.153]
IDSGVPLNINIVASSNIRANTGTHIQVDTAIYGDESDAAGGNPVAADESGLDFQNVDLGALVDEIALEDQGEEDNGDNLDLDPEALAAIADLAEMEIGSEVTDIAEDFEGVSGESDGDVAASPDAVGSEDLSALNEETLPDLEPPLDPELASDPVLNEGDPLEDIAPQEVLQEAEPTASEPVDLPGIDALGNGVANGSTNGVTNGANGHGALAVSEESGEEITAPPGANLEGWLDQGQGSNGDSASQLSPSQGPEGKRFLRFHLGFEDTALLPVD